MKSLNLKKPVFDSNIETDLSGNETDFSFIKRRLKNKRDSQILKEIKKDWHKVRKEEKIIKDKRIFKLSIGKYKLWLRKDAASSSIDTYLEIFKHKNHMKFKEFSGKNEEVIFDIGANEGFYTLAMKDNNPNLKIIAIEPVPTTFNLLKKNIKTNCLKNVILVNKAITLKKEWIPFQIVNGVTVISSVDIKIQKRHWLDNKRIKEIFVDSVPLKDLCNQLNIDKINILKIDVEGSEVDVLKSAGRFLKKTKKIVVEWHSEKLKKECITFLEKRGFQLIYKEKKRCGDLYFINRFL